MGLKETNLVKSYATSIINMLTFEGTRLIKCTKIICEMFESNKTQAVEEVKLIFFI